MSIFLVWRVVFFVLLVLLNGTVCATAGLSLSATTTVPAFRVLDICLIVLSAVSILFLCPIILLETLRRGASTSKIWFECSWLAVLWVFNLAAAAITMSLSPRQTCEGAGLSCATSQILVAITWVSTLLLLCQFLLVMISSLYYCRHQATVWSEPVNQLEWFRGGATNRSTVLGSGPPTPTFPSNPVPHLERMAVGWQSQATRAAAQPMEYARSDPQPLTLVFAPELPPSRAPIHYRASANVSVGALPTRKPSKRKPPPALPTATSLYPTSVQLVMDTPPERQQSPPPATRSPPVIPGSQTQNIAVLAAEPLPVQDWPRVNPQEPYRPKKSMTTYVPTVASTAAPMTIAPRSSVDSVTRTTPRGPRRRPSPLDLTAALPGAKRSK